MEEKKVVKAEELSEDELDQAAGGFVLDTVSRPGSTKMVKQVVKSQKTAVKALTDNKGFKSAVKSVKDKD